MKWSFPHFHYKGMLCSMAAFKKHCAFGFWKGWLIGGKDEAKGDDDKGMGQFGKVTKISDLPSKKVLSGYIKQAMRLNDEGVKAPARTKPKEPRPVNVRGDLHAALNASKQARTTLE